MRSKQRIESNKNYQKERDNDESMMDYSVMQSEDNHDNSALDYSAFVKDSGSKE